MTTVRIGVPKDALQADGAESAAPNLKNCRIGRARSFAWIAIGAFLVAVPAASVWLPVSGHDFGRTCELVLCLVCAAAASVSRAAIVPPRWFGAWCCAVLVLGMASTLGAPNLGMAVREGTLLIGLGAVSCVVAENVAVRSAASLLGTVTSAGFAYAALTLVGLATQLSIASSLRPYDLLIGYDNGRFFNHVQTSMLPLLALSTLYRFSPRWLNGLAFAGLAMGLALLVLSEGRATGMALIAGCGVGLAVLRSDALRILQAFARAGALAAAIYVICYVLMPRLVGMPVDLLHADGVSDMGSAHSRFVLWRSAFDGIRSSPWLGIGPMHFSHTWNSDAAHPHNVYLQVAEEWGLPMLLAMLGAAGAALKALMRAARRDAGDPCNRLVGATLVMTLVAIAIDGFFSGNFVMPVSQVWIAVVIGMAIGWMQRRSPIGPPLESTRFARGLAHGLRSLPLVATLWLALSVAPELETHFLDRPDANGLPRDAGAPRFWSNGWF